MADQFLDLVEQRLKTSLALESGRRQSLKSNLPFTILSTEGNSPVLHLFEVPHDRNVFGTSHSDKPKFGVVTINGCITVYDTMFRRVTWKRQTTLGKVSWGTLSWRTHTLNPSIMMHSRQCGFHLVKPLHEDSQVDSNNLNELLSSETHIGFCKPYLCSDQHVIVPIGSDKIGIHTQGEQSIQVSYTFKASIMVIKEVFNLKSSKYIMCTTEDGYVHVLEATPDPTTGSFKVDLVSQLLLPNYQDSDQQPIGLCIEGCDSVYAVGSNLRYMFLIKWSPEVVNSLKPFGKKILPTEGISCMAMREGKGILAAGCFDGTVRIFGFPEMNQISTINYHNTQINALLFINEKAGKDGRWYLLCGASDTGLSVWNIPSSNIDS